MNATPWNTYSKQPVEGLFRIFLDIVNPTPVWLTPKYPATLKHKEKFPDKSIFNQGFAVNFIRSAKALGQPSDNEIQNQ